MPKSRLLIIEGNEEVRENLAEILELSGYETLTAPHGLEGVKTALAERPDLILCDVMMPELDGYGVLNLLSENEATRHIPFVFITARTEKEDIRRGMNLGADDYITKPFYKDELLQVIRTRLAKAAARGPATTTPHLSDPARGGELLNAAITAQGQARHFAAGETVLRSGDRAHFVYRVDSGRVHLSRTHDYGRDYILADLGPGELFGTASAVEGGAYPYTARAAAEGTSCRALPATRLLELINTQPQVAEAVMHRLAGRVIRQGERLVLQAYDSVRRRTALTLCELHELYGGGELDLSREELAQMVGTTKESVIRALSDFRRDGLLETDGRKIRVLRPTELSESLA